MSYLNQLFEKIAADTNRPFNDFLPFINVLHENWYDTEEAIRQISDEGYDSMKIPKRVVAKIKQFTSKEQYAPKQQGMRKMEQQHNQPQYKPEVDFNNVLKEETYYEEVFANFLASLQTQTTSNKTKILDCLRILIKIVENIIQNPQDDKYKILKLSSNTLKNNILCYDSCACILEVLGFTRTSEEIMMLQPNIDHLKNCRRNLEIALEKAQNMHDPYQASFNSSSMMPNAISHEGNSEDKDYRKLLDELIAYRKEKMSHPPADRNVRIYHKKYQERDYPVHQVTLEQQFEAEKDPVLKEYWKKFMLNSTDSSTFKNKRKIEFEHLIKQPIPVSTLIKIRLPHDFILEGMFGPHQTVGKVIQFAHQYLQGDFYIYTTPPVVRMEKHQDKTLYELQCVPMGIFYLGVAEGESYQVRPEYAGFVQC